MPTLKSSAKFVGTVVASYVIWSVIDHIVHPEFYRAQSIVQAEVLARPRYTTR